MARKAKAPKFEIFNTAPNCFGMRQMHDGSWPEYFNNDGKITVEVGCARAELSLELARRYPDENFIGTDKKSDRMWAPAKKALAEKLPNIAFIQSDSRQLNEYFEDQSVDVIWVTFPDPYPRKKHTKNRLMNPRFIGIYKKMLKPGGVIRFKTDDDDLFNYFLEEVLPEARGLVVHAQSNDLHNSDLSDEFKIKTVYEQKWIEMGRTINFIELSFS